MSQYTPEIVFFIKTCQSLMRQPHRMALSQVGNVTHFICAPGDIKRIIGTGGETVTALTKIMTGLDVKIRVDEPEEGLAKFKVFPLFTLPELIDEHYKLAGQQVTAAVNADGTQIVVQGSQCDPSIDRALAAIAFKIAKNRGQVCNVKHC